MRTTFSVRDLTWIPVLLLYLRIKMIDSFNNLYSTEKNTTSPKQEEYQ
jgi:hypothetical protein